MKIFKSRLKFVRGTRFVSALFITVSLLVAAGILWGANMYYDIDAGKIMVAEIQEVTQSLRAVGGLVVQSGGSVTGGLTVDEATSTGNLVVQGETTLATSTIGTNFYIDSVGNASTTGTFIVGDTTDLATTTISETFTANENLVFGSDSSDTATFNADVASNLIPSADVTYDLGAATDRWQNLYVGTTTIGSTITIGSATLDATSTLDVTTGGNLTIQTSGDITATSSGDFIIYLGDAAGAEFFYVKDSSGADQLVLDSDGNLTLSGSATTTGDFVVQGESTLATTTVTYLDPADVAAFTLAGNITGSDYDILDLDNLTVNTIYDPEDETLTISDSLSVSGTTTAVKMIITTDGLLVQAGGIEVTGGIDMNSGNITEAATISGTTITIQTTGGNLVLDASTGQITAWDSTIYADSYQSTSTDATVRSSGDQIVRGIVPIFGFDLPAQTASTSYVTVSRTLENYPFPEAASGTTRVHKVVIRHGDDIPTASTSDWRVATTSGVAYSTFTVPGCNSTTTAGKAYIATVTIPTDGTDWWLDVKTPDVATAIRIFQIFLIAYDQVN